MKKFISAVLIVLTAFVGGACTDMDTDTDSEVIMEEFNTIVSGDSMSIHDVIIFLEDHIASVAAEDGTDMVIQFEALHKEYLRTLENDFYNEEIQTKLQNIDRIGIDYNNPEGVEDDQVKILLQKTRENWYKVEQAEGSYFPIIDYSFYQFFHPFVTPDIKEYLEIMAIESGKVPMKDGGMTISWEEVIQRALKQEGFLKSHPDSQKTMEVRDLYQRYEEAALYGSINTPIFEPKTKTLKEDVRRVYEEATKNGDKDSQFLKKIKELL